MGRVTGVARLPNKVLEAAAVSKETLSSVMEDGSGRANSKFLLPAKHNVPRKKLKRKARRVEFLIKVSHSPLPVESGLVGESEKKRDTQKVTPLPTTKQTDPEPMPAAEGPFVPGCLAVDRYLDSLEGKPWAERAVFTHSYFSLECDRIDRYRKAQVTWTLL